MAMRAPTVAGLLIVLVAGAVIAGLWVFGGNGDTGPASAATPEPTAVPDGPQSRIALTANMYAHPTRTSDLVAIVPEGRTVRVTGRTDDSSWVRVIYPVESTLEGWVPASYLVAENAPDFAALPEAATVAGAEGPGEAGGLVDEPALPDLTISSADVGSNGILTVRITNLGRATFSDTVGVRISTAEGEIVGSLDADLTASPLGPGRSAAVNTGVRITQTGLFVIEVDPANEIEESSEFNNSRRVLLVGVGE
jgi:hypothetical protein